MDCACVSVCVDDYAETLTKANVTARKEHRCCECRKTIYPGESYEYYKGTFDGDIFVQKTCIDCISVRDTFFCDGFYYEQLWDDMWEHIRDCAGEISEKSISALTPVAREKVCEAIEEEWEYEEEDN